MANSTSGKVFTEMDQPIQTADAPPSGLGAKLPKWIQPYLSPAMFSMLMLGFASGLPLYLLYQKTSFWLRLEGIERSTIGYFYWVGMAYSFKFLWAPIIDRLHIPILNKAVGHRRSWMLVAIFGTVAGLLIISTGTPSQSLLPITIGALALAFSGATLDVSIDAWRIESAPSELQANMAASYSLGYRGALIFSGLGFVVADLVNWNFSFAFMAGAMAVCAALVLLIKEPQERIKKSIDQLPFFAGPANAVAVGMGIFIILRIALLLDLGGAVILMGLAVASFVLLAGPVIFRATKTSLPYRILFAGLGGFFVYANPLLQMIYPFADGSKWLSLCVLLINFLCAALFIIVLRKSVKRSASAEDQDRVERIGEPARGKLYELFARPFMQVYGRYGDVLFVILALVMIYRLSDFTMGVMASPLYADLGYAAAVVGGIQSGPGVFAIFIGLFIGGVAVHNFGLMRSMIIGAIFTLVTNAAYAWFSVVAENNPDVWLLTLAICSDNLAGGFVTTVFIAYLSSLVDPAFAATQYALFSSLYAMINKFVAGFSGLLADAVGYFYFFLITASYAIPAILLVIWVMILNKKYPPKEISKPKEAT
ncbi:MAG: AmpG family muropeptide MFS transporter [bacterium]